MAISKIFKKSYTKAKKFAKKRYTSKSGGLRISQLVKDVALVKRSLNVEKKHIQSSITSNINVGQTNGNADAGTALYDITPVITQGVGYSNMTGNSVKLVSMSLKLQIKQMSATQHPMKVKMVIFKVFGTPQAANAIQTGNRLFDLNPITSLTDYNSERNVNYFKEYRVIKTKTLYLMPDPVSGEIMLQNYSVAMKMNHHLKYNQNTTTLTDGQLCVSFTCDSGNNSTSVVSTNANIPILKINSGATIQFFTKFYYVDN